MLRGVPTVQNIRRSPLVPFVHGEFCVRFREVIYQTINNIANNMNIPLAIGTKWMNIQFKLQWFPRSEHYWGIITFKFRESAVAWLFRVLIEEIPHQFFVFFEAFLIFPMFFIIFMSSLCQSKCAIVERLKSWTYPACFQQGLIASQVVSRIYSINSISSIAPVFTGPG